jgi:hypothetical protein
MIKKPTKPRRQKRPEPFPDFIVTEDAAHYGAGQVPHLTWKDRDRNTTFLMANTGYR